MDDVISRQAVLKLLSTIPPEEAMTKAMLIQSVKQMDAAQPERKRGRWKIIMARHKYNGEYREVRQCSECHAAYFHYANQEDIEDEIPNFCPNCGADMRGENDG